MSTAKTHDFSEIKTHTFRGRRFHMTWRAPRKGLPAKNRYVGSCDSPNCKDPCMAICQRQSPEEVLGTAIHETMHLLVPDLGEGPVEELEADLMRLLRRMKIKVSFGDE